MVGQRYVEQTVNVEDDSSDDFVEKMPKTGKVAMPKMTTFPKLYPLFSPKNEPGCRLRSLFCDP